MFRPIEVKVLKDYRLWLRYDDGAQGEVDLADLAGCGVFRAWLDRKVFEAVHIDESGALAWPGNIDLCPDSLYLRLTGKAPEEVFPRLKAAGADA